MQVRDLPCWPPNWRAASGLPARAANGEGGLLIAIRWDHTTNSFTLAMEHQGDRYFGRLEGEVGVLSTLYLLLGWHIGRPLANIGHLEMSPNRHAG